MSTCELSVAQFAKFLLMEPVHRVYVLDLALVLAFF